ncbi:MAG: DUF58 domain-containing protein [Rikenellaceae bacterium]
MNKEELIKKVRRIEIKTKGLSHDIFAGKYHSAFKGRGISFSEVREYREGDDIRDIDWNVTARSSKAHIKIYEEERELTMMLLVDISGSGNFGTQGALKRDIMTEVAATLSFAAAHNNDKVGCILFTDRIEKYIPPKKGRQHVLRIISELLDFEPESRGTDLGLPLKLLSNVLKKRSTAFVLSDFQDVDMTGGCVRFEESMKIASSKHDLVALRFYDVREGEMPNIGMVELRDAETGLKRWVDTSSARVRREYREFAERRRDIIKGALLRNRIDAVALATDGDYVTDLIRLFKKR